MKSDILDIVFENRNKEYGAYKLRKFYPGRIKIALGLMFIISIVFSAFTLLPKKNTLVNGRFYEIPEPKLKEVIIEPKETAKKTEIKKPEVKPAVSKTQPNQQLFVSDLKIVDDKEKTDSIKTLNDAKLISNVNVDTDVPAPAIIKPRSEPSGPAVVGFPKIDVNKPMNEDAVDVLPSYPGGMNALINFLQKNLQTPGEIEDGQIVNVRIKFVVGYNGKLQSFVTVLDGGAAYNNEVVRVLKKMPDWNPGKAQGENVSVYYTIPVKFVSEN